LIARIIFGEKYSAKSFFLCRPCLLHSVTSSLLDPNIFRASYCPIN
jgi:hypothetical protein